MKTSTKFSFSRLLQVLKYDMGSNWKTYTFHFLTITGIYLICHIVALTLTSGKNPDIYGTSDVYSFYVNTMQGLVALITPILIYWMASRIMRVMRTKEERVAFLMLPATRAEKFVCRALIVTVGGWIMLVLGLMMSDMLRFLFHPLFGVSQLLPNQLVFPDLFGFRFFRVSTSDPMYAAGNFLLMANLFRMYSFFILGGVIFRKNAMVKCFAIETLLLIILSNVIMRTSGEALMPVLNDLDSLRLMVYVVGTFCILLGILFWGFSYHLFTRAQIVRKKIFS